MAASSEKGSTELVPRSNQRNNQLTKTQNSNNKTPKGKGKKKIVNLVDRWRWVQVIKSVA